MFILPGTNNIFTQCTTFWSALISLGKLLQTQLAASEPNPTPAAGQSSTCTVGHIQCSNCYSTYLARKTALNFSSGPQRLHTGIQDASLSVRGSFEEFPSAGRAFAPCSHPMKRGRVRCSALAALQWILLWTLKRSNTPFPQLRNLSLAKHPCDNLIVFDLVTSELDNRCAVLQVATCLFSNTDVSFSVYVLSTRQISLDATAVTHFSLGRASDHNVSLRNGINVVAVCWSLAEEFFRLSWLNRHITIQPCCTQLILFWCICYCSTHQAHSATKFRGLGGKRCSHYEVAIVIRVRGHGIAECDLGRV